MFAWGGGRELTGLWGCSHIWGAHNFWREFGENSVSVFNINMSFLAGFECELHLEVVKQIKEIACSYAGGPEKGFLTVLF